MVKLWCDFSVLDRGENGEAVKRNVRQQGLCSLSLILVLGLKVALATQLAWSQAAPVLTLELMPPEAPASQTGTTQVLPPRVGDRLTFQAELPSAVPVSPSGTEDQFQLELLPNQPEPNQTGVDPEAWGVEPLARVGAQVKNRVLITAVPLKPGNLTLPRMVLKDASGKVLAETQTTSLEVASAIRPDDPKPAQPEGVEPPVGLPFPFWVVLCLGVLATLALAGLSYLLFRWWKKRLPRAKSSLQPSRPEHEVALDELAQLEKSDLIARGEFKAYYFRVSEIMKAYIGARFRLDALESTTMELLSALERNQNQGALAALFEKLDRVKFSDWIPKVSEKDPIRDEPKEVVQEARRWVETTRQTQSVSENAPENVKGSPVVNPSSVSSATAAEVPKDALR